MTKAAARITALTAGGTAAPATAVRARRPLRLVAAWLALLAFVVLAAGSLVLAQHMTNGGVRPVRRVDAGPPRPRAPSRAEAIARAAVRDELRHAPQPATTQPTN